MNQQQRLLEEFNKNRHGRSLLQEANCTFKTGRDLLLEDEMAPNYLQRIDPTIQRPPSVNDRHPVFNTIPSEGNAASALVLQSAKRPRFDLTASSIDGVVDDGNSSEDSLDEILNFNPFSSDRT